MLRAVTTRARFIVGLLLSVLGAPGSRVVHAAEPAGSCSLVPPPGYVVGVGFAPGRGASANRQALDEARRRLLGQVCSNFSVPRCLATAPHVRDWTDGRGEGGGTCALAAVEERWLRQVEDDAARWRAEVGGLARAVKNAVGDRPLALDAARWAGPECPAGVPGAAVEQAVRDALLAEGVALLEAGGGRGASLGLRLSVSAEMLAVAPELRADGATRALPGHQVPGDVVGVDPARAGRCEASASASAAIPVVGTVTTASGTAEEVHYLDGCTSIVQPAAADPAVVATYLAEARSLCTRYERFQLGAADHARRVEELDRWLRSGGRSAQSESGTLSVTVEATRKTGGALRTGSVVVAGDRFLLSATPSRTAHLYVVYENSAGERQVFPPNAEGVLVAGGQAAVLPSPGFVFEVDANGGRAETLHVIASLEPLPVAVATPRAVVNRALRGRGVNVVPDTVYVSACDGASDARRASVGGTCTEAWYGDPGEAASGYGAAVYTLSLDHR